MAVNTSYGGCSVPKQAPLNVPAQSHYPMNMRSIFSFDRKVLVDGILKHSCIRKDFKPSGVITLQFRDSYREYTEEYLRSELGKLSLPTLTAVMASFMRNPDGDEHRLTVFIVREYIDTVRRGHKIGAERILYYVARLSSTLVAFTKKDENLYRNCVATAVQVAASARLFKGADDKSFRKGGRSSDRHMKGIAAWFCLGRTKIKDLDTLYFLTSHLDILAPHADLIRTQKFFDVPLLQELVNMSHAALETTTVSVDDEISPVDLAPLEVAIR